MIATATQATHAPIHANLGPIVWMNEPMVPRRVPFPIPNSRISSGTDQRSRKTAHATRKVPPPLEAAMRGKRQMFPVPMAMPSMARSMPQRDVNTSDLVDTGYGSLGDGWVFVHGAERAGPRSFRWTLIPYRLRGIVAIARAGKLPECPTARCGPLGCPIQTCGCPWFCRGNVGVTL